MDSDARNIAAFSDGMGATTQQVRERQLQGGDGGAVNVWQRLLSNPVTRFLAPPPATRKGGDRGALFCCAASCVFVASVMIRG